MGTRADFYVGKGEKAEWIGSIAWDGYPDGVPSEILNAKDESKYREKVTSFLNGREDKTLPEDGWPWPWEDSNTTDYAYSFDGSMVVGSCFGGFWFDASNPPEDEPENGEKPIFPNMENVQNVSYGKNSGLIFITR